MVWALTKRLDVGFIKKMVTWTHCFAGEREADQGGNKMGVVMIQKLLGCS